MSDAQVDFEVRWTDFTDAFEERLRLAARRAIAGTTQEGVNISRVLAPKKTLRLVSTIHAEVSGAAAYWGKWSAGPLKYVLPQEEGAVPHMIGRPGQILRGPEFGPVHGPVHHPGNPAVHFLLRAYESASARMLGRLRSFM